MLRLILMRHAKSGWDVPGLADHDRALNTRGQASAQAVGAWMRRKGYLPDQVISSSATRTLETLAGLALDSSTPVTVTRALYLAQASAMLEVLKSAEGSCVLMLGHNDGIAEMAARLVATPPDHDRFEDYPTCATLVCDFDESRWNDIGWHQGQPIDFIVPRELG